jgi:iron complex outermembrane receptor protein
MKRLLLMTVFTAAVLHSYSQEKLRGLIFDETTKTPLAGATIVSPGIEGITTDKDGMFTIDCGKATKLSVSFVGYQAVQLIIKDCNEELKIGLEPVAQNLNEVEITATSNRNKSILYQPQSISKLTTTELKRNTGLFLDDAINQNVPGVIMERRGVSSGQSFNIRGYGNGTGGSTRMSSNFDGQGYKVYLNGIPITDAEGITVMDDIDFNSIGNVEVVKGPAGTLYGLAVSGVVNLNTIKPAAGKTSVGQDVLVGSYGLQRFTTHFETATDHSSLLINYGHQFTQGYTIHNNSTKDFVNIAGDFNPNQKESVTTYFGYSKSYDQRSGELTIAQYNSNDFSGNPDYLKRNAHCEVTSFRVGIGHTYHFSDAISNTTTVFGTGAAENSSSAAGWTDKMPVNYGLRSVMNTNFSLKKGFSLSGITGIEMQQQRAQIIGYTMVKNPADPNATWFYGDPYYWIVGPSTSNKYTISSTSSLFTEWSLAMPHDISVIAGLGYSNMKIDLNDRFYVATNTAPTRFDTTYTNMFSPHLSINKVFDKKISVYFSYSKGYKAPTSSYFYIPFVTTTPNGTGILNNHLKPEIGDQFEIGTKGVLLHNKLDYQLAIYDAIFSNKMSSRNVLNDQGTTTLYTYVVNAGKQDDKGIEASVRYTVYQSAKSFIESVRPFANFTFAHYTYGEGCCFHYKGKVQIDSVVEYNGKDVAGVPHSTGTVGVDVQSKNGFYASASYYYKDGFPITSDGLNRTTSYALLNAKLGYRSSISAHFDIDVYAGDQNIAGVKYPIDVFVNQIPDVYLAGPRTANYYGGVNLRYNF